MVATLPRQEEEVPFTRLDNGEPWLLAGLLDAVAQVAAEGAFTLGEHLRAFERDFAAYCEVPHALGVSSGTDALALALRALRIGPGDEVLVPANSFIATAEAVSAVGARPRLIDVDPDSGLIDADIVAAALRPAVRCVIPVHLYGATVQLDPILALCREAGVHVLEDAAQAHGARYRGRRVGTLGALGAFSFYPAKNLGAWGDGGAVVTSDPALAERVELLRSHGERPRYRHRVVGTTARLDAVQAAVLARKLPRLDAWNDERRRLAARLRELLAPAACAGVADVGGVRGVGVADASRARGVGVAGADGARGVRVLHAGGMSNGADHVHHLFVIRCAQRDRLRRHLAARGIASAVHYPTPIHLSEAYAHLRQPRGSLPACEELAQQVCSLPLFPGMREEDLERVARAVTEFAQAPKSASR